MLAAIITTDSGGVDVDVAALSPGDYIEPASIEAAYNVHSSDRHYGLRVMQLKGLIEGKSIASGRPLQCKTEGCGVRVLTAEEAVEYNYERFLASIRGIDRAHEWMRRIDTSGLSAEVARLKTDREAAMANMRQAMAPQRSRLMLPIVDGAGAPELSENGAGCDVPTPSGKAKETRRRQTA